MLISLQDQQHKWNVRESYLFIHTSHLFNQVNLNSMLQCCRTGGSCYQCAWNLKVKSRTVWLMLEPAKILQLKKGTLRRPNHNQAFDFQGSSATQYLIWGSLGLQIRTSINPLSGWDLSFSFLLFDLCLFSRVLDLPQPQQQAAF